MSWLSNAWSEINQSLDEAFEEEADTSAPVPSSQIVNDYVQSAAVDSFSNVKLQKSDDERNDEDDELTSDVHRQSLTVVNRRSPAKRQHAIAEEFGASEPPDSGILQLLREENATLEQKVSKQARALLELKKKIGEAEDLKLQIAEADTARRQSAEKVRKLQAEIEKLREAQKNAKNESLSTEDLQSTAEISSLHSVIEQRELEVENLSKDLQDLHEHCDVVERDNATLRTEIDLSNKERDEALAKLTRRKEADERRRKEHSDLIAELERERARVAELQRKLDVLRASEKEREKQAVLDSQSAFLDQEDRERWRVQCKKLEVEVNAMDTMLQKEREKAAASETRLQSLQREWEAEEQQLKRAKETLQERESSLNRERQHHLAQLKAAQEKVSSLEADRLRERERDSAQIASLTKQIGELQERIADSSEKLASEFAEHAKGIDERAAKELKEIRSRLQRDIEKERNERELGQKLLEESKKQCDSLRAQLESVEIALVQFQEESETEREQFKAASEKLEGTIAHLNEEKAQLQARLDEREAQQQAIASQQNDDVRIDVSDARNDAALLEVSELNITIESLNRQLSLARDMVSALRRENEKLLLQQNPHEQQYTADSTLLARGQRFAEKHVLYIVVILLTLTLLAAWYFTRLQQNTTD